MIVGSGPISNEALITILEEDKIADHITKDSNEQTIAPPLAVVEEAYSREREVVSQT